MSIYQCIYSDPFEREETNFNSLQELLEYLPEYKHFFPYKGEEDFKHDCKIEFTENNIPFTKTVIVKET